MENHNPLIIVNSQLAELNTIQGVSVTGMATDSALVMKADYVASNTIKVGSVTIKPVDIKVRKVVLSGNFNEKNVNLISESDASPSELISTDFKSNLQIAVNEIFSLEKSSHNNTVEHFLNVASFARFLEMGSSSSNIKDGAFAENDLKMVHTVRHDIELPSVSFELSKTLEYIGKQVKLNDDLINDQKYKDYVVKENNEKYENFPVLNSTLPINNLALDKKIVSQEEVLLSRTYSEDHQQAKNVIKDALNQSNNISILKDIFAVINLGIAKGENYPSIQKVKHVPVDEDGNIGNATTVEATLFPKNYKWLKLETNEPFKLIHSVNKEDLIKIDHSEAEGVYVVNYNIALFLRTGDTLFHELTHAVMNILFNNDCNPYIKNSHVEYKAAVDQLLSNISFRLMLNEKILPVEITEKLILYKNSHYDLSPIEESIIARIGNLADSYTEESFDRELVATMFELYYKYGESQAVQDIFLPIHQYWIDNIHPIIENELIIPHQQECNGLTNSTNFVHCVEEFMV